MARHPGSSHALKGRERRQGGNDPFDYRKDAGQAISPPD